MASARLGQRLQCWLQAAGCLVQGLYTQRNCAHRKIPCSQASTFSQSPVYVQVARGVIGLVVTGHYPLNHHPARLAVEHLEQYSFGWKEISQWFSYLQSIIFVLSTTAVAVVVSSTLFTSLQARNYPA